MRRDGSGTPGKERAMQKTRDRIQLALSEGQRGVGCARTSCSDKSDLHPLGASRQLLATLDGGTLPGTVGSKIEELVFLFYLSLT